jgi:hypothetical protein
MTNTPEFDDRLRLEMRDSASDVELVDLTERVLRTSRKLRRRRVAATGFGALVAAAAVALGAAQLAHVPQRVPPTVTKSPAPVRTHTPGATVSLPDHAPVVAPVHRSGGRETMTLTFDDGSQVAIGYPAALHIGAAGWQPYWGGPTRARPVGDAVDADGLRHTLWQDTSGDPPKRVYAGYGDRLIPIGSTGAAVRTSVIPNLAALRAFHFRTVDGFPVIARPGHHHFGRDTYDRADLSYGGPELRGGVPGGGELRLRLVTRCFSRSRPTGQEAPFRGWHLCRDRVAMDLVGPQDVQGRIREVRDGIRVERVKFAK